MYISLFDVKDSYHGIQRQQDCLLSDTCKNICLYDSLLEDEYIPCTQKNINAVFDISDHLQKKKSAKEHEVILYGREQSETLQDVGNVIFEFLGFDVSGDSLYLSPLKTVFFESKEFLETKEMFFKSLNESGLFTSINVAFRFIRHIQTCEYEGSLESDGMLTPIWIYRCRRLKMQGDGSLVR